MFKKGFLAFFLVACATVSCHVRLVRSPDSVQMDVPGYSTESPDQDRMNEEGEYWEGERDKHQGSEEDRNNTAQQNHENFDDERDYREQQEQDFNNNMEEDYENNRDKLEDQEKQQDDHYNEDHQNDEDLEGRGNGATDNFNEEAGGKGERYEEKGTEDLNSGEEKMENYDGQEQSPSMTYTRD